MAGKAARESGAIMLQGALQQSVSAPDECLRERERVHTVCMEGGRQGDRRGAAQGGLQGQASHRRNSSSALPSGWGLCSKGDREEGTAPGWAYQ